MLRFLADRQELNRLLKGKADTIKVTAQGVGQAGKSVLPPRYALGAWWSRYWAYHDQELRDLVGEFNHEALPLDVLVVDMDWHTPNTWTGYTWNRDLFPDPPAFLQWVHAQGLHVTLNLHPADGVQALEERYPDFARAMGLDHQNGQPIPFRPGDRQFMRHYFELLHHPLEDDGVDFWWMDWQQGQQSDIAGLDPLPWLNHLHFMDATRRGQRPMFFSRYGGLGSHRYYFGFSGDTYPTWETLAFQPYFTATAANVGFGWWSHDIGGHYNAVEPELYVRWVQFGALSPALRLHSTNNPAADRRPWGFTPEVLEATRAAFHLRYQLVPYLYSAAWHTQQSGLALCLPMYYHHPELDEAYVARDQYYFGPDMIAAPITAPAAADTGTAEQQVWLPPGLWYDWQQQTPHTGPGWVTVTGGLGRIPLFVRAGAAIPLAPPILRTSQIPDDHLHVRIAPPAAQSTTAVAIYLDDGESLAFRRGEFEVTTITTTHDGQAVTIALTVGPEHCPALAPERAYTISYGPTTRPRAVLLDGQPWEKWDIDEERQMVRLRLPQRPRYDAWQALLQW